LVSISHPISHIPHLKNLRVVCGISSYDNNALGRAKVADIWQANSYKKF
jgi:hypothetical protein